MAAEMNERLGHSTPAETASVYVAHRISQVPTERLHPLNAIHQTISFSSRDWGSDGRDAAWLYGIVCGWDDEADDPEAGDAMTEVAARSGWSTEQVDYLRALRRAWKALEEAEAAAASAHCRRCGESVAAGQSFCSEQCDQDDREDHYDATLP